MTTYRVEFTVSDEHGHELTGSYEHEPSAPYDRDSWAIASELGSYVSQEADNAIWFWFATTPTPGRTA